VNACVEGDVFGLAGKLVVVTGGSNGIGRSIAMEFARQGCKVCGFLAGREGGHA
jgi:NAD(P)-dependent dehydrogenase (short-subunit alcohol dehydrogenase family)